MMKRLFFSGAVLAGDVIAQTHVFLSQSASNVNVGLVIAGAAGVLLSLYPLAQSTAAVCLDHGETYDV